MRAPRILVIIGSTAVGKSKLGIELAQSLACSNQSHEIINADSMQIYDALSIATAKVAQHEQNAIPHHLLSEVDFRTPWTVHDFSKAALVKIREVLARDKVPIIVGGTFYYVEALIWNTFLSHASEKKEVNPSRKESRLEEIEALRSQGFDEHSILASIDPIMADRFHPHQQRKIRRSIEVYVDSGRKHSELIMEHGGSKGDSLDALRFDPCIFWLDCDKDVLRNRMDLRVNKMLDQGLLQECEEFHEKVLQLSEEQRNELHNKGIFQSIGYKEFIPYFEAPVSANRKKVLLECIEILKTSTRQYSKRQSKWIRNRLQGPRGVSVANRTFRLDTSKIDLWNDVVLKPALEIAKRFFDESVPDPTPEEYQILSQDLPPLIYSDIADTNEVGKWENSYCDTCEVKLYGKLETQVHFSSRKHKRALSNKYSRERMETMKKARLLEPNKE